MKLEFKSLVNKLVENTVLSSTTISTLVENMQTLSLELSKVLSILVKINDRLNKHEQAILQICENQIAKKADDNQGGSSFEPPRFNKPSQKPN